jgi:signal peptidase I
MLTVLRLGGLMDPADALDLVLALAYFGVAFWMLWDAVRRGRKWFRWQALLYFIGFFAVPFWFFRRRRWPVAAKVAPTGRRRIAAIAAGAVAVKFVLSPLLSETVTTHLFQIARVEGTAMAPTLNDQDRLIVNKRVYRVGDPAIGDIVMLSYPLEPEKSFVKRVIASGGDEVRVEDGVLFRNGMRVEEPYVSDQHRSHDDWGPEVVPEDAFFVMGDHRNNSSDSRHWGFVPREYMLGRVTSRWWPLAARREF